MRPNAFCISAVLLMLVLFPAAAFPDVINVRQDGSGDYYTIPEAVAVASPADTIEVGPGTYTQWVDVSIPLTIVSTDGPGATIMNGQTSHRHMTILSGVGTRIEGFTFIDGRYSGSGGSIRVMGGAEVIIEGYIFENNESTYDGGAILVANSSTHLDVINCTFIENNAPNSGGGATVILNGEMSLTGCTFIQNSTVHFGGAIACGSSHMDATENLFVENSGTAGTGAVFYYNSSGLLQNNTFYMNASSGDATVYLQSTPSVSASQNIFSNDTQGYGLMYSPPAGDHTCNIFWNNADGPILGASLDPTEKSVNPYFCDPLNQDFTVAFESPAAPSNSPCGELIGAFPPACTSEVLNPEPLIISILDLPNDHGREVRIKWHRSSYDAPGDGIDITGYGIYRYQGEFVAGSERKIVVPPGDPKRAGALDGWDFIETVPARGDSVYQYVAPTLCDSTVNDGMCWSVFFVSAMTPDPLQYYDSPPDSGYSLDNLAPAMPQGVVGWYDYAPVLLTLHWHPNTEFDLAGYRVYRGEGEDFVPSEENLIAATPDTLCAGLEFFPVSPWHIKVTAVDINGNESACAVLPPSEIPIATFVSSYQSAWMSNLVEVSWVLNEAAADLDFKVLRKASSGGYADLACAVTRNGDRYRFEDASVESGETYSYRVFIVEDGRESLAFETTVSIPILKLDLKQNHPNPFNPATTIPFSVPGEMHVNLVIYDSQGRLVKTLVDRVMERGLHAIPWDGTDAGGNTVASGVYFYRMKAGKDVLAKKMLMLK